MVISMTRKPRRKKVVEPEPVVDEPTSEPVVTGTTEPSTQTQIGTLLQEHPPFLPAPTMRYYGETLYPWLHKLETLLETA